MRPAGTTELPYPAKHADQARTCDLPLKDGSSAS